MKQYNNETMKLIKSLLIFLIIFSFTTEAISQTSGCTDPNANNYNPQATQNDGSCTYNATAYNPQVFFNLPSQLEETSGVIFYAGGIWSHNDSGGEPEIYKIDTVSGQIVQTITLQNATNIDWEDISQDDEYIYVGDFGNNAGNRDDLKIYIIDKNDIPVTVNTSVPVEIINFEYSDQKDFSKSWRNNNFDCEAMIVKGEKVFLFSKNWLNSETKLYELPKYQGNYTAQLIDNFDVEGLITGADINIEENEVTLIGYKNQIWIPFVWLLFDYDGDNFFSGNKRRIDLPYIISSQTEGICYYDEKKTFISAEKTQTTPQRVYKLNTGIWTNLPPTGIEYIASNDIDFKIIPNPVKGKKFKIEIDDLPGDDYSFEIYDSVGRKIYIKNYSFKAKNNTLKIKFKTDEFSKGIYFIRLYSGKTYAVKKLIIN